MKIILFTLEYPPQIGGIADYYGNLVEAWPQAAELSVFNTSGDKKFKNSRFFYWPRLAGFLIKNLKQKKAEHILVGHILPLGAITYLASFFSNFSYSVCLHGLDFSLATSNFRKRKLSYLILSKADKIICANSYLAQEIIGWQAKLKKKIIVINPGAKVETASQPLMEKLIEKYQLAEKKIIFSLGRLVVRKGFDQTIKALALLKKNKPLLMKKVVYLLAGDGQDKDRLKKLVAEKQISDQVIFLGRISQAEKFACFALADIFCMPSRQVGLDFEGFGIVYLEANLFKKPVIAGLSGGVYEAVVNKVTGLLVDPTSVYDLSLAINKLLVDEKLAKQLGQTGYNRASQEFNWTEQAKKLKNNLLVS